MGFTHIELMPLSEYPTTHPGESGDGILCGDVRYGKPEDLMYLIDCAHAAGLGVLLDWVPGPFPKTRMAWRSSTVNRATSAAAAREHKGGHAG